jgi:hypothetical protein
VKFEHERWAADFLSNADERTEGAHHGWYIAGEWHNSAQQHYVDAVVPYLNPATEDRRQAASGR